MHEYGTYVYIQQKSMYRSCIVRTMDLGGASENEKEYEKLFMVCHTFAISSIL